MANQTRQLAELLRGAQATVVMVQSNRPYAPAWVGRWPGVRALFRLVPYLFALWRAAARSDLFHVMANSGWAWHLFSTPAIWIARARAVPVVVNYRGGEAASFLQRSAAIVRWSMRRTARLAVPSAFLEQVFGRHGMHAVIVPNVIDLGHFRPHDAGERPARHVVVARNLEAIYDNATALRALALVRRRCPDAHMTIAGSGPEAARLQALAAELGLADCVRFTGRLDRDGMAALYRDADLCVNPSRVDNMPNSLLEAMASGVPVVSTNVGGVPFIVQDRVSALLVASGDPDAMADALVTLIEDRSMRRRLAAAALREVERYSWTRVAPVLADVYRNALARARA
ncbi:MAG: glycosyltransferase [Proteobacteria bacterium]|nr:glycosyltransferase [Pseudomonadota bacterium]